MFAESLVVMSLQDTVPRGILQAVERGHVNLILLESHDVDATGAVSLSGARAAHLLRTLKVTSGQTVRLGILDGPHGTGTVVSMAQSATGGTVELYGAFDGAAPPRPRVDLLLALPRPKVLRRLWAQLAALGVGQIILTNAERVERNYFDTHVLTPECYRPLLIEGLQQARDTRLPRVSIHRQFKVLIEDALDGLFGDGLRLVADAAATCQVSAAVSQGRRPEAESGAEADVRALVAIGPEGGWNAFELALLQAHGFQTVGMGPRTLRTDTACIALTALVHDSMESG